MAEMTDERRIELLATLLETQIADIGYPVGCGIAPHPETVKKMAADCFKVATAIPEAAMTDKTPLDLAEKIVADLRALRVAPRHIGANVYLDEWFVECPVKLREQSAAAITALIAEVRALTLTPAEVEMRRKSGRAHVEAMVKAAYEDAAKIAEKYAKASYDLGRTAAARGQDLVVEAIRARASSHE